MRFHRAFLAPALGLVLTAAITACSSSSSSSSAASSSSSAPASSAPATTVNPGGPEVGSTGSASTVATITSDWETFFASSTPESKRLALLQNGPTFASAVKAFAASPLASAVTAKVDSVKVNSPAQATVTYDLTAAGTSVAKGATGNAVLQNGTWKVGDQSFCGLLKEGSSFLNIKLPAACSSAS
jgi:hypothetical protein